MFGIQDREQVLGRNAIDFVAPEDRPAAQDMVYRLYRGERLESHEHTLLREDGTRFIGEITAAALNNANGRPVGLILIVRDITEQKQAEDAINEVNKRFRALFEDTNDAVFLFGLDLRHIAVNQQAADLLGYQVDEMIGRSALNLVSQ